MKLKSKKIFNYYGIQILIPEFIKYIAMDSSGQVTLFHLKLNKTNEFGWDDMDW